MGRADHSYFDALTDRYVNAFTSEATDLGMAVQAQCVHGRPQSEVIENIVASLAPTWCHGDDPAACASFLERWGHAIDSRCESKQPQGRTGPDIALLKTIGAGIQQAIATELEEVKAIGQRVARP